MLGLCHVRGRESLVSELFSFLSGGGPLANGINVGGNMKPGKVPQYVLLPLDTFLQYLNSAERLLKISMRAISMVQNMPDVFEAIAFVNRGQPDWDEEDHKATLQSVKTDACLAKKECDTGFPLLHDFVLVGLWGAFEAAMEDAVVAILCNETDLLHRDPFAKIRIPLADFETLDKEDRMRILLSELQRTLRSDQRQGVTGFEAILNSVGLAGGVTPEIREAIWEMHHVRNIIVHRRSCVDRAFVAACPKFGLSIGDRIVVTGELLGRFVKSLAKYAAAITYRMKARYGEPISKPNPCV